MSRARRKTSKPRRTRGRRNAEGAPAQPQEEVLVPALLSSEPGPVANPGRPRTDPSEALLFFPVDAAAWRRFRTPRFASNPPEDVARLRFEELAEEIEDVRGRILAAREALHAAQVGKEDVVDLMLTCTAAQEPFLLVGPPGTGKSQLINTFCDALAVGERDRFEYVLTKFTEPSELFGPVDMARLKEGAYVRRTQGKLPEAQVAFLDEVFRGNSAILNTLLTVMNERKFYQDGRPEPVKLTMLFGATNKIPEFEELNAIRDRFTLKVESGPVKDERFDELLEKGLSGEVDKSLNKAPPWADKTSLDDFLKVKRWMDLVIGGWSRSGRQVARDQAFAHDRRTYFPEQHYQTFKDVVSSLEREAGVYVSDRKVIRLYRLIRTRAFLLHGGAVTADDVRQVMRHVGDRSEDLPVVREKVDQWVRVAER